MSAALAGPWLMFLCMRENHSTRDYCACVCVCVWCVLGKKIWCFFFIFIFLIFLRTVFPVLYKSVRTCVHTRLYDRRTDGVKHFFRITEYGTTTSFYNYLFQLYIYTYIYVRYSNVRYSLFDIVTKHVAFASRGTGERKGGALLIFFFFFALSHYFFVYWLERCAEVRIGTFWTAQSNFSNCFGFVSRLRRLRLIKYQTCFRSKLSLSGPNADGESYDPKTRYRRMQFFGNRAPASYSGRTFGRSRTKTKLCDDFRTNREKRSMFGAIIVIVWNTTRRGVFGCRNTFLGSRFEI